MIKALISDFGGVLVRTRTDGSRRALERQIDLPPGTIEDRVFSCEMSQRAMRGEISEGELWRYLETDLDLPHYGLTWQEFQRRFFEEDFLDEDLMTFFRDLRPALKIGLISNMWDGLRGLLTSSVPIAADFDALIISAEAKMLKPDPRIYQLALEQLGVQAAETIFLDDFIENIHGAQALGLRSVHFQSSQQACRDILTLLQPE